MSIAPCARSALCARSDSAARAAGENTRCGRVHGEPGRGQAREAADRHAPVRAPLALAGRAAARRRAERVPEDALLGGVRRLAPRPHEGAAEETKARYAFV